jgi:hypothetical protein
MRPSGCQRVLQLKAVETRHGNVENGATRNRSIAVCEEFLWGCERPNLLAVGSQESRQRLQHAASSSTMETVNILSATWPR